jgi:putative ABC transport system substrate-binding protein
VAGRTKALFVAPDTYLSSRRVQLITLAARHAIPAAYSNPEPVRLGGLMGYSADTEDLFYPVGEYTGRILKGAKPSDLSVIQATKFNFAINLTTARALGLTVPPTLLAIADEVIE